MGTVRRKAQLRLGYLRGGASAAKDYLLASPCRNRRPQSGSKLLTTDAKTITLLIASPRNDMIKSFPENGRQLSKLPF